MNKKWLNYAGLVLVAVIWGANFGISRLAMESFHPIVFSFLRFGVAIPFFFLILKLTEGSVGVPWRLVPKLMLIGLLGITLLEITVMYSIKYTTLANASLLNVAPWPIFVALFAVQLELGLAYETVLSAACEYVDDCIRRYLHAAADDRLMGADRLAKSRDGAMVVHCV
ncbi:EamA family transporter [Paenibacillus sp. MCAF20]